MTRLQSVAALLAIFALVSCGDGGSSPPRQARVRVLLTDAPFPYAEVARVDIHVVKVSASIGAPGPDAGTTIVAPDRAYELVELKNGRTVDLGEGILRAGSYDHVTLTIDVERSSITLSNGVVLTGTTLPGIRWATPPGTRQITINAQLAAPIDIQGETSLVIDFDLAHSFLPTDGFTASSGFDFAHGVRAVDASLSGAVTGSVRGDDGSPVPDAMVTLSHAAGTGFFTARTDALGAFRFAYARPGIHTLIVGPPLQSGYLDATHHAVVVTRGQETSVGVVTVQRFQAPSVEGTWVLRYVGSDRRPPPAIILPLGAFRVELLADTIRLGAAGAGSRVTVTWAVNVLTHMPNDTTTSTTSFTYHARPNLVVLNVPCSVGSCTIPTVAALDGNQLVFSGEGTSTADWPRVFERVAP